MGPPCANPLLLQWLKERWDLAREQSSKGVLTYKKAYESMKACPMVLQHPSEAKQLQYIGDKLCAWLTQKLEKHCQENGLPMPTKSRKRARNAASEEGPAPESPPKRTRKAPKQYVPKLRSGVYAIILALSTVPENQAGGGLTKAEIINIGQAHCDSSFTAPSDPSKFHTAWNSMKTLQNHELIYEFGRPAKKYALTEEGWQTARGIRRTQGLDTASILDPQLPAFMQPQDRSRSAGSAGDRVQETRRLGPPSPVGTQQRRQDERSASERPSFQALRSIAPTEPRQTLSRAGLGLDDAAFVEILSSSPSAASSRPPSRESLGPTARAALSGANAALGSSGREERVKPPAATAPPLASRAAPAPPSFDNTIAIPAGSYTVELLLDTREVRSRTDRDYIQTQLERHGVAPTTRALELGDCLWVARVHDPATLARLPPGEGPDIVLEHVAERKRLDDLVASLRDGRFREQKFRLARCGVPNVIYLVEHMTLGEERERYAREAIASAIAGTQAAEGFFVKRTRRLDESCRYLAHLTHALRRRYADRPLRLVPAAALQRDAAPTATLADLLRGRPAAHRVAYATWAGLVGKSASMTLREVFLKMLLCTRGVSGDRALEVQRRWRTPRELVQALERCGREANRDAQRVAGAAESAGAKRAGRRKAETPEEAAKRAREEMVFRATEALYGRAKIGKAVSAKIARVWADADTEGAPAQAAACTAVEPSHDSWVL